MNLFLLQRRLCPVLLVLFSAVALTATGCGAVSSPQDKTIKKTDTVEQVTEVRRLLRSSCQTLIAISAWDEQIQVPRGKRAYFRIVRSTPPQKSMETLLAQAEQKAAAGQDAWAVIVADAKEQAPSAYKSNAEWVATVAEISKRIDEMLNRIKSGKPLPAMGSCGKSCGLFVKLNTGAGVKRTCEKLFMFRKAAKPLFANVTKGDRDVLQAAIAELHKRRDAALKNPQGGKGSPEDQATALKTFSKSVDAFTDAVKEGGRKQIGQTYERMIQCLEKAYDLYL